MTLQNLQAQLGIGYHKTPDIAGRGVNKLVMCCQKRTTAAQTGSRLPSEIPYMATAVFVLALGSDDKGGVCPPQLVSDISLHSLGVRLQLLSGQRVKDQVLITEEKWAHWATI
ncbi:uncharacterized protein LOC142584672 [Dermacentor variabilis]|uniref:uncharacterized protein LOC142584672 n=1 Tax=Dermacentor variabilis TaxID=34621 RepID=UPI003F5C8577